MNSPTPEPVSIMIASPCFGGAIDANTAGAIYASGLMLKDMGVETGLYLYQNDSYIPSARNRIALEFINSNFTHLLCIDADIGFEPSDVLKLIKTKAEFVVAAYPQKNPNLTGAVSFSKEGGVERAGLGFCLLKRSVFEKLSKTTELLVSPQSWGTGKYHNFYGPIVDHDQALAEDYSFCLRWCRIGGRINLASDVQLTHFGKFGYKFRR